MPATNVSTCFDKNMVWVCHNGSASDFISVVLIRTLPCTKQTHFAMISPVLFCFVVSTATVLPLTGIHPKKF